MTTSLTLGPWLQTGIGHSGQNLEIVCMGGHTTISNYYIFLILLLAKPYRAHIHFTFVDKSEIFNFIHETSSLFSYCFDLIFLKLGI